MIIELGKLEQFPHGEVRADLDISPTTDYHSVTISCPKWQDDRTTMQILQYNDILKSKGYKRIKLLLPYFPYSRQDRATTDDSAFSLKIFCQLLKSCEFHEIITWDIHSQVALGLLPNLFSVDNTFFLLNIVNTRYKEDPSIVLPDAGANSKYINLKKRFNTVEGSKIRDPRTGKLSGFDVHKGERLRGKDVIIVDDICAMGGTFLGLENEIQRYEPKSVSLAISHFDCVAGEQNVSGAFKNVFHTSSSCGYLPQEDLFLYESLERGELWIT